ncbi:Na+/H+ antiporter NhaC [Campylobacter sp. faydin G-24]|uniref:Na+/H+ antiporter NhaC n=1 Tax=Campylobacter anatolicus TaxID=2829105 RepID=A0ABS5HJW3_9BACT|nr:Na+/H+ antiporter NhaC [Campylobacter anatolicus]MBR8464561.1 Na+/H+ antiporter NhaC [Campylobacter anatolicus]
MSNDKRKPTFTQSVMPILVMILGLAIGVGYLKLKVEPIILISALVAGFIAWRIGYSYKDLEAGIIEKISSSLPALMILWAVGFMIGAWMFSGTIPMIIYYGVEIVSPKYLVVTAFLICAILSTVTGTSWGSAGTVGVAVMGIAQGLGVDLAATAGAVVAGAYFGDKLSPLSDTTNLAPIAAGSELYEHISHMFYTTIPATIVALLIYFFIGSNAASGGDVSASILSLQSELDKVFDFNIILLLPALIVLAGSFFKWPTIPAMLISSFLAIIFGIVFQDFSLKNGFVSVMTGFNLNMTGLDIEFSKDIMKLLNRGGVSSVNSTTMLVICAMAFAGILSVTGMLNVVLHTIMSSVKTQAGIIISTISSCVTVAFLTGSSYLSILVPGEMFRDFYKEKGLAAKNLSRTLEDSGTVIVPLIPWSAAGAYMTATLGVATIDYLPWAVVNYMGIVFAVILAITGIGIAKIDSKKA